MAVTPGFGLGMVTDARHGSRDAPGRANDRQGVTSQFPCNSSMKENFSVLNKPTDFFFKGI